MNWCRSSEIADPTMKSTLTSNKREMTDDNNNDNHSRNVQPKLNTTNATPTSSTTEPGFANSCIAAIMPKAVATKSRQNGCWVPPVVALAHFYNMKALSTSGLPITMENVAALRTGDEPEEVCEIFEEAFDIWMADKSWSNHPDYMMKEVKEEEEEEEAEKSQTNTNHFTYHGVTAVNEYGTNCVSRAWFEDLKRTIDQDDAVLLLVERQERKDFGKTHYLVCLGYKEEMKRRRGSENVSYTLFVKDPTEGDEMLVAKLWEEGNIELCTKQHNGSVLDRYMILEANHLAVRRYLQQHHSAKEKKKSSSSSSSKDQQDQDQ